MSDVKKGRITGKQWDRRDALRKATREALQEVTLSWDLPMMRRQP